MTVYENISRNAICDTQDKFIDFFGRGAQAAANATVEAVRGAIGFRVEPYEANGVTFLIFDDRFAQKPLTVPERAIIAAFAKHFKTHTLGLERGKPVHFPKVISSPDANADDMAEVGFESEARAYMFAEAVGHVFNLTAEVIEAPGGESWLVAVSSEGGIDGSLLEQLRGACAIAEKYAIDWSEDNAEAAAGDTNNAPLTRIESALGKILSRLGESPATPAKRPAPVAVDVFDEGGGNGDKHRLPAPSRKSGKSSAKSK